MILESVGLPTACGKPHDSKNMADNTKLLALAAVPGGEDAALNMD